MMKDELSIKNINEIRATLRATRYRDAETNTICDCEWLLDSPSARNTIFVYCMMMDFSVALETLPRFIHSLDDGRRDGTTAWDIAIKEVNAINAYKELVQRGERLK